MERVSELVADGYLFRGSTPNTIILAPKGLGVLISLAERPLDKSKLVKVSKESERELARKREEGQ